MNKRSIRIEIEDAVCRFRKENGLGTITPVQLSSLLLKKNTITIFKPLSDNFAGMAIKTNDEKTFMMINKNHIIGKQHFTIGHELYHLFVQDNFTTYKCDTGLFDKQKDIEEKKADYFAACLLLPNEGVKELIPQNERSLNSISDTTIFKIQQYYRLSVNAVIYRLIELDFVDSTYYRKYKDSKKITARKLGYDMSLYEPRKEDKTIGNYGILANKLFKNGIISESYYFELLNAFGIDIFENDEHDI